MNLRLVGKIIGGALVVEAMLMVLSFAAALIYSEDIICFVIPMAIAVVLGLLLYNNGRGDYDLVSREGFVSTGITWIVLSLVGMLPFIISGAIPHPINAFFETVSGFTTTGATVITDIEIQPKSILLWRSSLHWIGGMGILVFMSAIMHFSRGSQINLVKAESTGPVISKLVPKAGDTARVLYGLYSLLSFLTITALLISGFPFYDSLCLMFSCAGTGGFGILNDSCASYTTVQQIVLGVSCGCFGVSFTMYFLLILRKFGMVFRNEELRAYLAIVAGVSLITFADLMINSSVDKSNPALVLHSAAFNTISILTTTGFAIDDVNLWPRLSQTLMLTIMIIGGCAGSTGGGIKVSRVLIMFKSLKRELVQHLRPGIVKKVHMDGKAVDEPVVKSIGTYCFVFMLIIIVSVLLVSLENKEWDATISSVLACFNNIGPGVGENGTMGNYAGFSFFSKLVLTADMLIGRLEIYPILALFSSNTWRSF